MISPMMAARAYASIQGGGLSTPSIAAPGGDGPDFAAMVKTAVNDVATSSQKAETQMAAQVQGKADMVDVVTAVASAQASLQTMMAVRDQVITAYQQIMSMPV